MWVSFRSHTTLNPNNTVTFEHIHAAIQTYYVLPNTTSVPYIQPTNENQSRAIIAIVVYLDNKMAHEGAIAYRLILTIFSDCIIEHHPGTNQ